MKLIFMLFVLSVGLSLSAFNQNQEPESNAMSATKWNGELITSQSFVADEPSQIQSGMTFEQIIPRGSVLRVIDAKLDAKAARSNEL